MWRMVQPPGTVPASGFFGEAREITFGLMLPRCFVVLVGRFGDGKLLNRTHQDVDEATAIANLLEWADVMDGGGAVMVVEPQTIHLPTGVKTYDWVAVPEEWVSDVLMPAVDALPRTQTV